MGPPAPSPRDGGRRRLRPGPVWAKAPLVLLRYPGLLMAVVAAAVVVGVTSAAGPLFLAAAAGGALANEMEGIGPRVAGLTVEVYGPPHEADIERADVMLREAAAAVEGLDRGTRTMVGSRVRVRNAAGREQMVRLLSREGAPEHLEMIDGAGETGVWISERTARPLGLSAGEQIEVAYGGRTAHAPIAGVYHEMIELPLPDFWQPFASLILPQDQNRGGVPPALLIADAGTHVALAQQVGDLVSSHWNFPLRDDDMTVVEARRTAAGVQRLRNQARDRRGSDLGTALGGINAYRTPPTVTSALGDMLHRVDQVLLSMSGPVRALALAGGGVALVVVAASGLFAARSRRVELQIRAAQGVLPSTEGARAAVEALLPVALGILGGWWLARALIDVIGPGPVADPAAPVAALRSAAAVGTVALLLLGLVTTFVARRALLALGGHVSAAERLGRRSGRGGPPPWEVVPLSLATVAYYQVVIRGTAVVVSADRPVQMDVLVLAFPVLFIAGFAGLGARGLRAALPHLRRLQPRGAAAYLAVRRLAGGAGVTAALAILTALSVGVLVYAATTAASTAATVEAKAQVAVGSDVVLRMVGGHEAALAGHEGRQTLVRRRRALLDPGGIEVDLLAIDPSTFRDAAYLDADVLGPEADAAVDLVRHGPGDGRAAAVVAGAVPGDRLLFAAHDYDLPLVVARRVRAFPGTPPRRPLVVVDWAAVEAAVAEAGAATPAVVGWTSELWVADADQERVALEAGAAGLRVQGVRSADEVRRTSGVQPVTWTLGLLQALGYLAGLLSLVGMLLHAQSRQQSREVSYALARRMGLRPAQHWAAVALEIGTMLLVASAIGAGLALLAAALVQGRLDPLPQLPPDAILRLPWLLLAVLPVAVAVVAAAGAGVVQRSADRADVAEVMRLAE